MLPFSVHVAFCCGGYAAERASRTRKPRNRKQYANTRPPVHSRLMECTVKVCIRIRPEQTQVEHQSQSSCVSCKGRTIRIHNPRNYTSAERSFIFDRVFDSADTSSRTCASQEDVYNNIGAEIVSNAYDGFNTCLFAYGQTGSGKTYTMLGHSKPPHLRGVIPRACEDLFARMSEHDNLDFTLDVTYYEIYNEAVCVPVLSISLACPPQLVPSAFVVVPLFGPRGSAPRHRHRVLRCTTC